MEIIDNGLRSQKFKEGVITIGGFDGVHFAHRLIIEKVLLDAKTLGKSGGLVTFEPLPSSFFNPNFNFLLTPFCEKMKLLKSLGLDFVFIYNFNTDFAQLKPLDFLAKLKKDLNPKKIIVGSDFRFGSNREGDVNLLKKFTSSTDWEIELFPPIKRNGVLVKSTTIREKIILGNLKIANLLLGREYSLIGKVIRGKQKGRILGFPTANFLIKESQKLIPPDGVYAVRVKIGKDKNFHLGVLNIGTKPTLGLGEHTIEVHIIDFNANILEKEIEVFFVQRLRAEQKFANLCLLKEQIKEDVKKTINLFKKEQLLWLNTAKFVERSE